MADASEEITEGERCLNRLDYEGAFKHFEAAIDEDPKNAHAYFCKAEASLGLERLEAEEIANLYKKALDLDPKNPQYLDGYASFCLDIGHFKEAEEAFNRAAEMDEENAPFYFVDFAINYFRKAPIVMGRYMDDTTRRLVAKKSLDYVLKALGMDKKQALEFLRG